MREKKKKAAAGFRRQKTCPNGPHPRSVSATLVTTHNNNQTPIRGKPSLRSYSSLPQRVVVRSECIAH